VEEFQNNLKKIFKGKKCESIFCQNYLGLDDTRIVCEHLLPQGKFPQYAMHPMNVAFVCGCVNLDNYTPMEKRLQEIGRHFPHKLKWIIGRLRKEGEK
jgi:hypothetical protein